MNQLLKINALKHYKKPYFIDTVFFLQKYNNILIMYNKIVIDMTL